MRAMLHRGSHLPVAWQGVVAVRQVTVGDLLSVGSLGFFPPLKAEAQQCAGHR
jgi:hypothetical protein